MPSFSALRAESLAPAGEQLVGVCLMPYVKYETVARSVEYIMYCHNQVHRTHTRTEMPWVLRQIIYKIFTYLPAELEATAPRSAGADRPDCRASATIGHATPATIYLHSHSFLFLYSPLRP